MTVALQHLVQRRMGCVRHVEDHPQYIVELSKVTVLQEFLFVAPCIEACQRATGREKSLPERHARPGFAHCAFEVLTAALVRTQPGFDGEVPKRALEMQIRGVDGHRGFGPRERVDVSQ